MSYTPTQWATGDTVTAERLNKMEGGIETAVDPFVVTLTPTAQDFSGVMDKTVAEINEAYTAGQKIVFRLYLSATESMETDVTSRGFASNTYPSFNTYTVTNYPFDALVNIWTGTTDDGTQSTYSTDIYPLTPMS